MQNDTGVLPYIPNNPNSLMTGDDMGQFRISGVELGTRSRSSQERGAGSRASDPNLAQRKTHSRLASSFPLRIDAKTTSKWNPCTSCPPFEPVGRAGHWSKNFPKNCSFSDRLSKFPYHIPLSPLLTDLDSTPFEFDACELLDPRSSTIGPQTEENRPIRDPLNVL